MARLSKLTEGQWAEIIHRADEGEPQKDLAREFGVSEGTISKAISKARKVITPAVNVTIEGERLMAALTPAERAAAECILDSRRAVMGFVTRSAVEGPSSICRKRLPTLSKSRSPICREKQNARTPEQL